MYINSEVKEDIVAQRFDENDNVIEEVVIPKGVIITILDMGGCAKVLAPEEYKGLMFTDGYEDCADDEEVEDNGE